MAGEIQKTSQTSLTAPSAIDSVSGGLRGIMAHNDLLFAFGVAVVLATLLIPLPTLMLDVLLTVSIAVAISTLLIVLSARESLELSTFPSLLLFVTLFRLSLNVASTRLILSKGDAGDIIQTFGSFVVGGGGLSGLVIGLVVFVILVVIQFVVITKGAERISEVAARFNLDAMPGKQMAIDADLNAGLIGEEDARNRRSKIVKESEFYGAMDGASKFIRGDAIAGVVITAVNLVGGFIMGMTRGMGTEESINRYSLLAVGDGLVTQIPAVIISTASGFLISKTSTQHSLSGDLMRQVLSRSRPLWIASFLLGSMAFVPGFPILPFAVMAIGTAGLARVLRTAEKDIAKKAEAPPKPVVETEQPVEEMLDVDRLAIQVGPRLIRTVDPRRKNSLSQRIAPLRKKFAQQYGIILPLVRLRDSVTLDPNIYEIRLNGHVVSTGTLESDKLMAMDPGTVSKQIKGLPAQEPVFNLPALWIDAGDKEQAELAGYTVVDPETVMVTHLSETLKRHAHELLSRDDVQQLVERLKQKQPALVNGVVGELISIGLLHRVLQGLLRDGIPIRDLGNVIESLGDNATRTKDIAQLTEGARKALVRTITEQHADPAGRIMAITIEPSLEYELRASFDENEGATMAPERALDLMRKVVETWRVAMEQGHDKAVLLCDYRIRPHLAAVLSRQLPQLNILAYDEIAQGTPIESIATVTLESAGAHALAAN